MTQFYGMRQYISTKVIVIIILFLLLSNEICYAASGFVDSFNNYRHWIFPAYAYSLAFGIIVLIALSVVSLVWKTKIQIAMKRLSLFLRNNRVLGIIITGVILAIPIGILNSVSSNLIGFFSIFPTIGMMIIFPFILSNRYIREKLLLSPGVIKWSLAVCTSAIIASLLFIILTDCNLLSGTNERYVDHPFRSDNDIKSHPYDSMIYIWLETLPFMAEIVIALILYWTGMLIRYLRKKLFKIQ